MNTAPIRGDKVGVQQKAVSGTSLTQVKLSWGTGGCRGERREEPGLCCAGTGLDQDYHHRRPSGGGTADPHSEGPSLGIPTAARPPPLHPLRTAPLVARLNTAGPQSARHQSPCISQQHITSHLALRHQSPVTTSLFNA